MAACLQALVVKTIPDDMTWLDLFPGDVLVNVFLAETTTLTIIAVEEHGLTFVHHHSRGSMDLFELDRSSMSKRLRGDFGWESILRSFVP